MNLYNLILNNMAEFQRREGKIPNELHIPFKYAAEFEKMISKTMKYSNPDPEEINPIVFMGMRVFNELFSFGCDWTRTSDLVLKGLKYEQEQE